MKYVVESREEFYPDNSFILRKDFISENKIYRIYQEINEDYSFYYRLKYNGSSTYIVTGILLNFIINK